MPYLCHPLMSVLFWVSHIFLIAAVTSFLSCILNVRTYPRLSSFSLSLENCPMRSRTKTSELSSGRNRTRSTLSYSRVLSISVSILRTSTSYFSQDSFTFRSFYPRNRTCSSPSISALQSLSSTSAISSFSAFSLQLCLALALSASNTCDSSSTPRASLHPCLLEDG